VPDKGRFIGGRETSADGDDLKSWPKPSPASGADFDEGLDRAEALLREVEQGQVRVRGALALALAIPLVVALILTLAIGVSDLTVVARFILVVFGAVLVVVASGSLLAFVIAPGAQRLSRDEYAMIEIVGVLRELMGTVAEREGWSAIRQHITRTRIARFPIGLGR
jgi:hypothetical protein